MIYQKKFTSEDFNRSERLTLTEHLKKKELCWLSYPDIPWSFSYYYSNSGQSNFHVYLWLLKDLSWTQCWYWPGMIFGCLAFGWQVFMLTKSVFKLDFEEIWKNIAMSLWLGGHFWWMSAELHDYKYPNETSYYDRRTRQTGEVFAIALIWVSAYYIILKPFRSAGICFVEKNTNSTTTITTTTTKAMKHVQTFKWRFPWYFHSWSEYENIHILFWLAKDTAWNWWIPSMLVIFLVPTLFLALDFVWVSLWCKRDLIDHAHYLSQFFWVCAAIIWALGEFFFTPNHDQPLNMTTWNHETKITSRWYSSWCYVLAFLPIVLLHIIWIYGTITGKIQAEQMKYQSFFDEIIYEELNEDDDDNDEEENKNNNNKYNGNGNDDDDDSNYNNYNNQKDEKEENKNNFIKKLFQNNLKSEEDEEEEFYGIENLERITDDGLSLTGNITS